MGLAVYQTRLRSVRMKTQLTAAHDAQMAIMPQAPPDIPGVDIAWAWIPAYGVGGDFYDTFWLEGEPKRLGIVVADVAGKGMRAAMNAVMSDGMVFSRARQSGSGRRGEAPAGGHRGRALMNAGRPARLRSRLAQLTPELRPVAETVLTESGRIDVVALEIARRQLANQRVPLGA